MNAVKLYKFIRDNAMQCSWVGEELILWLHSSDIGDFAEMIDRCHADDGGYPCRLQQDGNIVMTINDLCDEYDIDPLKLIEKDEVIIF